MAQSETFEGFCILELMGHRKLAGMVREVTIAGAGFLRLDVPSVDGTVATQFIPPSSLYCLTPCSEDIARRFSQHNQPQPVTRYELPAPAPVRRDEDPADYRTRVPIARDVEDGGTDGRGISLSDEYETGDGIDDDDF